ncbi:hypothetical protein EW146_g2045 [Bondarzewia mesenterica]|uniref:Uncharacterized protein n=1 Tax=Bondarzewia mesenterica TaxID=1095465 RepID=A0A4S4M1W9_9AGAM|nr:hypothetical protein EW146_g2045 [Bondarzewia mesenterica]
MIRAQDIPVGPKPGWELEADSSDEDGSSDLKSVADSLVVVNSLKQSRANWLSSMFPKFSSKSRGGKTSEASPPPHTIKPLGKCDLEVGPHIFLDTAIYEVHYLPIVPGTSRPPQPAASYYNPSGTWQTGVQYGSTYAAYGQYVSTTAPTPARAAPTPPPAAPLAMQRASTPFVSSIATDTPITPSLISQVNAAAATNPILANLIQLAASGRATPEQLKTLGLLITSLNNISPSPPPPHPSITPTPAVSNVSATSVPQIAQPPTSAMPSSGPTSTAVPTTYPNYGHQAYGYSTSSQYSPQPQYPVRDFDIILEFREKPYDRWMIPRGPVVCERKPPSGILSEILLSAIVPFPNVDFSESNPPTASKETAVSNIPQEVITFRLKKVHQSVWDGLSRWAGDADKLVANRKVLREIEASKRQYLQYQVPPGDLLAQLQAAAAPPYAMKSLKSSDRSRPRRSASRKKLRVDDDKNHTPKRRRSMQAKNANPPKQIACISCGQTDVPLMIGGRFCRTCVDSGKSQTLVPTTTGNVPISSTTSTNPEPVQSSPAAPTSATTTLSLPTPAPLRKPSGLPTTYAHSPLATNPPILPTPLEDINQSQPKTQ